MDMSLQEKFLRHWNTYFPAAELPLAYYYTDEIGQTELPQLIKGTNCLIYYLGEVRQGNSLAFDLKTIACMGGRRYTGFSQKLRKNFEYFLSCGIPDELEGERYKKSPELVSAMLEQQAPFFAPGKFIVFKRWDRLEENDQPLAVIFFATPDVLSGLFTLANYDEPNRLAVIAPMGAGCASIVQFPLMEIASDHPRAVLGMFDISARPHVPENVLTFTVPLGKLAAMVDNMDESFLITHSWKKIQGALMPRASRLFKQRA